jgi:hypothetical protein
MQSLLSLTNIIFRERSVYGFALYGLYTRRNLSSQNQHNLLTTNKLLYYDSL